MGSLYERMEKEPLIKEGIVQGFDIVMKLLEMTGEERKEIFGYDANVGSLLSSVHMTETILKVEEYIDSIPRVGDYLLSKATHLSWYVLDTDHLDDDGYIIVLNNKGFVKKLQRNTFKEMRILDRDGGNAFKSVVATLDKMQSDAMKGKL